MGEALNWSGKRDGQRSRALTVPQIRVAAPAEDDSLAHLMQEISRELAADGVTMAWTDGDGHPAFMFAQGDTDGFTAAAIESQAHGQARCARSEWRTLDGDDEGGMLTTTIPAASGLVTITSIFRSIGQSTRSRARDAVTRLLPLIQPFFEVWASRVQTLARVRGLVSAINISDVGILLVDRDGRRVFANETAEALAAKGDAIRWIGDLLSGVRMADTIRLQVAIEHAFAEGDDDCHQATTAPVIAIERKDRRPLMAVVSRAQGPGGRSASDVAVIHLFDPEQNFHHLLEPICKFYGLSPTETRLACMLADGVSLGEAAERMRIRELTARSYLKQVFLKTQTNRQAELVWLLLRSTVRTSPGCRISLI